MMGVRLRGNLQRTGRVHPLRAVCRGLQLQFMDDLAQDKETDEGTLREVGIGVDGDC